MYSVHCAVSNFQCAVFHFQCWVYNVQCKVTSVKFAETSVKCALTGGQCAVALLLISDTLYSAEQWSYSLCASHLCVDLGGYTFMCVASIVIGGCRLYTTISPAPGCMSSATRALLFTLCHVWSSPRFNGPCQRLLLGPISAQILHKFVTAQFRQARRRRSPVNGNSNQTSNFSRFEREANGSVSEWRAMALQGSARHVMTWSDDCEFLNVNKALRTSDSQPPPCFSNIYKSACNHNSQLLLWPAEFAQ